MLLSLVLSAVIAAHTAIAADSLACSHLTSGETCCNDGSMLIEVVQSAS